MNDEQTTDTTDATNDSTIFSLLTDWRLYAVVLVVLLPCIAYWLLADHGRDDTVGEQLEQAVTAQQSITAGANDAKGRTDHIAEGVSRAIGQADNLGANLTDAGAIIVDCQNILRAVRQRAEAEIKDS